MIKKIGIALLFCLSANAYAVNQCRVDIKNEIHLDGSQVEIYQENDAKVLIDKENNVFINGNKLDLDQMQKSAIESYREHMNEYVPKAVEIARNGLTLAKSIIDDIADRFNNSKAFDRVKTVLEEFFNGLEQRYKKEDKLVLQQAAFSDATSRWEEDLVAAKEVFNAKFFSGAFVALSEQMIAEDGLNLTDLKYKLSELQVSLENRLKGESKEIEQDVKQYCEDLEKIAEEERMLHEKIPQLKDYQVFII